MMAEELGLMGGDENPKTNALVTFLSFVLFGVVPCKSSNIIECYHIS